MRVRPQLSTRSKRITLLAVGILAVTGCGTRLPDKDFALVQTNGSQAPGAVASSGPSSGPLAGGNAGQASGTNGTNGTAGHNVAGQGTKGTGGGGAGAGNLFAHACGPASSAGNKASDTGVSNNQIVIGNVSSRHNQFGSDQFIPNYFGLIAFVGHCNAVGGIHGRQIKLAPCDDQGNDAGNTSCINQMISAHAFAMVANNMFSYPGAQTAYKAGLLDIGGEPIKGHPYYQYNTMFNIYGDGYPKDGKNAGYQGHYWGTGEEAQFMKSQGIKKVGVVYYDQQDSARGYAVIKAMFQDVGIPAAGHSVNLADPNYQNAVVQMKQEGDDAVFDALDSAGNQQLCQAMNSYHYLPKAKVSTIAAWTDHVGDDFAPPCRDIVWAAGKSASYNDTSVPMVNTFRQDFARYGQGETLSQWAVEGYIAGIWFAQAANSCGGDLTRSCVSHWLYAQKGLTAEGLMPADVNFIKKSYSTSKTERDCTEVVKWNQGKRGWDTLASIAHNCYTTRYYDYALDPA